MPDTILVDALGAAELLGVGERKLHALRQQPDWPRDAEVRLGPRCVRFRVDVLRRWVAELAINAVEQAEPKQLRGARERRRQAA